MKRTFATALLAAVSLMAPAGASAQSSQQATIPFDFTVGQRVLPAGTYVIAHFGSGMIARPRLEGERAGQRDDPSHSSRSDPQKP